MKVLGITLARGGSKGVPKKNVRKINRKPLLAYTIEEAHKSHYISRYVVSTENGHIAKVATEYGADVVHRPRDLAEDDTPSVDALQHAITYCEKQDGRYDVIADLRCTNPLKTVGDIDGAIAKLIETDADVVCGVTQLEDHHPSRIKWIFQDHLIDFYPEPEAGQRQDLRPKAYIRNGSIYIVKRDALMDGVLITGSEKIRPWIMPLERSVNIDTELDFMLAEVLINVNPK